MSDQSRPHAGRPGTALGRWLARLPRPNRRIAQAGLLFATVVVSHDGSDWSDSSVLSEPGDVWHVGVTAAGAGLSAVWALRPAEHEWRFQVSRRRP